LTACANWFILVDVNENHIGCTAAAQILGCSTATIKRLAKSGQLPAAFKMDGQTGAYVFERDVVEAFAAERAA
jgi:predicted DNA-binding transcriptional regulator AlpA